MDGAKVGVLEETNEVSLGGFLEGEDGGALESEVVLVLSSDLADESLEGELADEELGALLEASDLTESDGARSEAVGLLDTTSLSGLLGGGLVGDVLAGVLGAGVLASSLLCACHYFSLKLITDSPARFAFITLTIKICDFIGCRRLNRAICLISPD